MKKILSAILCVIFIFCIFAACGETENSTTTTTTTQLTTTTKPTTTTTAESDVSQILETGYWYFCNPDDLRDDLRVFVNSSQLHIKSIEGNVVTFDLIERRMCDMKDVKVTFDGNVGKGTVDGQEITMYVGDRSGHGTKPYHIEVEYIGEYRNGATETLSSFFDYRSDTPVTEKLNVTPAQNYNLESYTGMWFATEGEMNSWRDSFWTYGYLNIKNVEGNKVTLDYQYVQLCGDADIVVEINNNVGLFVTKWTFGIIEFKKDGIKLTVSDVHYGPEPICAFGRENDDSPTMYYIYHAPHRESVDSKKGVLDEYVGYWFVDEQNTQIDKEKNAGEFADIEVIEVIGFSEKGDEREVAVAIYERSMQPTYYGWLRMNKNSDSVRLPIDTNSYWELEFEDGKITRTYLFEDTDGTLIGVSQKTFTYKAEDSAAYEAIFDHNVSVMNGRYSGYWYMYDEKEDLIDELHIKSFDRDSVTFDYSHGDENVENINADIRDGYARFAFGDLTGLLEFTGNSRYSWIRFYVCDHKVASIAEYAGFFDNKLQTALESNGTNYDLNEYSELYWHTYEDVGEYIEGMGPDELYIKEVDGNKLTFSYVFSGVAHDEGVTAEIRNNFASFKTQYGGDETTGIIKFEEDGIYLAIEVSEEYPYRIVSKFRYPHTHSGH